MALQKTVDTWKLKKWFTVYAPKQFNEVQIAEMPANDEKAVVGRNIKVALSSLTNNPAHAYTEVILKVTDVNGEAAHTKIIRVEQLYSYIRSLVRRYRSVASGVFPAVTKDDVSVVAKMLVITKARTAHTKINGIRKETKGYVESYFKDNELNTALSGIIEGKMQNDLSKKLAHIAPINRVEVKKLEVV